MDSKFIVLSLLRQAEAAGAVGEVIHAVRLDKALDDRSGEGYLLCLEDKLCVAERPLGQSNYHCLVAPLDRVKILQLEKSSSSSFVRLDIAGVEARCVWSWAENKDAEELLKQLQTPPDAVGAPRVEDRYTQSYQAEAGELFVAGLMYAAECSGQLSAEQETLIRELAPPDRLRPGLDYYHHHELVAFVTAAKAVLSEKQMISLLANQLEVLMVDGDFRSAEREGMERLAQLLGLTRSDYRQVQDTILYKNQSPLLFA